jgi:hypothetical protein
LSHIWAALDDPDCLFRILDGFVSNRSTWKRTLLEDAVKPMTLVRIRLYFCLIHSLFHQYLQHFHNDLSSSNWERFLFYAEKVRELRFKYYEGGMLDCSTFAEFARIRPVLTPIRRLQRLYVEPSQCSIRMKYIILFLHDGLDELDVYDNVSKRHDEGFTGTEHVHMVRELINDIANRATGLRKLRLHIHAKGHKVQANLVRMIPKLRNLSRLELHACLVTPSLVLALSQLPKLTAFKVDNHVFKHPPKACLFCTLIEEPLCDEKSRALAFPSLSELSLRGRPAHIAPLLSNNAQFARLTWLVIDVLTPSTEPDVQALLQRVAEACPHIQIIELCRKSDVAGHALAGRSEYPLTVRSILSMQKMTSLTALTIESFTPERISDEELSGVLTQQDTLKKLRVFERL